MELSKEDLFIIYTWFIRSNTFSFLESKDHEVAKKIHEEYLKRK